MNNKVQIPFIKLKPIDELEEITSLEPGNFLFDNGDGNLKRMSTDNFYQLLHRIATPISTSTAGPFTANTWHKPLTYSAEPGTNYPNAGNLKAVEGYDTLFFYNGTTWTKYTNKLPGVVTATYDEFKNRVNNKAAVPAQIFEIIGNYEFTGQVLQLTQDKPYNGFNLTDCNAGIPGGTFWTYKDEKYANFTRIVAVDLMMAQGTFNIYIYAKSDYSTPSQIISVTASSMGVKRHVFTTPINPATHKVFVSGGVFYNTLASTSGVVNISNGLLVENPTIAIGMLLIGEKDVIEGSKPIMDRLSALENKETPFTNYLYRKSGVNISDISADTGGGTFTINVNGLILNSTGANSGVTLNKQINLSQRYLELRLKLKSDTIFYIGTKNVENTVGENTGIINCGAKTIVTGLNGSTVGSASIPFDIVNDREYIIRYYKLDNISRLELIDTITTKSIYAQDGTTLGQFDKYRFGVTSGTIGAISQISIVSIVKDRPYIGFYGDSITEGNSVGNTTNTPYYRDRFANLIGEKLGKPYFVSGRSGGETTGVLARMKTELPTLRPKYVFVTIGTNGNPNAAQYNSLVDYCESLGITVILNLIPLYNATTAGRNAIIQSVVDSRRLMSVKTNIATSVNGDGITKDNSMFANEAGILIHPNEAGNLAIYSRALIDVEKIFSDVGVF